MSFFRLAGIMAIFRKRNIILFLVLIIITAAFTGYYFYNKGPVDIQQAAAQKVAATTLYNEFIADTAAAQKKYSGKILLVSGNVADLSVNQQGQSIILLKTGNGGGFINCTLQEKTTGISKDQPIQVKGSCSGLGQADEDLGLQPDLYLERCIIQP